MDHELFEELDAWRKDWQQTSRSIWDAAQSAGPRAVLLYHSWIRTDDGANYERLMGFVPNYAGAIAAAQESAERAYVGVATMKD